MQASLVPLIDWLVVVPVLLPLLGAALLLIGLGRVLPPTLWAIIVTAVVAIADMVLLHRVMVSGPLAMTMGRWLPPFGISFVADTLGAALALTAGLVTLAALLYQANGPVEPVRHARFLALVLVLLAGAGGAFLTGDLFNLYVWFEVTLIASFGMLIFASMPLTMDAAVKYGILNFLATSLFLLALGLLYGALGTLNMADIVGVAAKADPAVMGSIAALLLVAFGTKAAAFPVNGWLPASYHAPPAAISALLGGMLTKIGAYALLRTLILLLPAARDLLSPTLAFVAGATLLLAPLGAIADANLRRAIGYMLIGGIGAIIAGLALPSALGISGAVTYIINAMLAIAALYLVAGLIESRCGETDTRRMGGLYRADSWLSLLFLLLILTMAGIPPFLGFWPKWLLLQAAIFPAAGVGATATVNPTGLALAICLLLNALLTLIAGGRLWSRIFWRTAPGGSIMSVASPGAVVPIAAATLLTALVVGAGLWPEPLLAIGKVAAAGLLDPRAYVGATGLGAP
jgi:multicomponent Na+:H+ antiporter subunit D